MLFISIVSFNLLTGAESPASEKVEQNSKVEYNELLKYERHFLRKAALFPNP
ncbi:hypothetical protein LEP1GSC062_0141 [Leptospira alexanderi serovar Manhao 3 str. L 60]|uniref:Uncharacterized protein n=2 Tax=Leptospira alexanderi TaxID=100053 RepID=V6HSU7_9LEPT|nr:hypothetical protein LEP1GSC062_0141 [Leptospira alexanderi serovar Manhao 3 str. L 60]